MSRTHIIGVLYFFPPVYVYELYKHCCIYSDTTLLYKTAWSNEKKKDPIQFEEEIWKDKQKDKQDRDSTFQNSWLNGL